MCRHQALLDSETVSTFTVGSVPFERRLLLLPHCLRPPEGCPGKMTREGLDCRDCSRADCKILQIIRAAASIGYTNICVAPGGRLAVRRVAETRPELIVAVACDKELEEGVAAVNSMGWEGEAPLVIQVPLSRDGCVETDVDMDRVLAIIGS